MTVGYDYTVPAVRGLSDRAWQLLETIADLDCPCTADIDPTCPRHTARTLLHAISHPTFRKRR